MTRKPKSSRKAEPPAVPAIIDAADTSVVDQAVTDIKSILGRTLAKGMEEVGEYLLKTFYNDDLTLFHSHSPIKHASLRALAERCGSIDLPVNPSFLSNAIRMAALSRQLPEGARFRELPPSHRAALLSVHDHKKIEKLAATAIEKGLTVIELRTQVEQARDPEQPKRGRPRIPEVIRTTRGLITALTNKETGHLVFRQGEIKKLTEEELEELKESVSRAQALLERLAKLVEG